MRKRIGIALVYSLCLWIAGAGPAKAQFTLSGVVTDPLAAPVESVNVALFLADGTPIGIPPTRTNVAGQYSIVGLPPTTYELRFEPLTASRLVVQNIPDIQVQANTVVNVSLVFGHILSGFVRDEL
ncbi:MAG: carboxypeptidase-like regulatory domain-containing protein, partial [Candidatus Zixiibacteriota bacterium]